jgi:hypothetical protein
MLELHILMKHRNQKKLNFKNIKQQIWNKSMLLEEGKQL